MPQTYPPVLSERKTVELCGEPRPDGKCIRPRGHDGAHETLPRLGAK